MKKPELTRIEMLAIAQLIEFTSESASESEKRSPYSTYRVLENLKDRINEYIDSTSGR